MQVKLFILFAIISSFLYIFAPMNYSWNYCVICSIIYIINAVLGLYPILKKDPINFSLFFSLTLFISSYIFPIFVYPIDSSYSLFSFNYDQTVISKCTSMVTLAHSMYWLGISKAKTKYYKHFIIKDARIDDRTINIIVILVIFFFITILSLGGLNYYTDRYQDGIMSTNTLFQYFNLPFTTISILLACVLIYANKTLTYTKSFILLGVIIVVILFTGSRTLPMFLLIPLVYVYKKRNNISLFRLIIISLILLFVFSSIGRIRNETITVDALFSYKQNSSDIGYFDSMRDFIVCNRNLYAIYHYVNEDGVLYGKNFLASFLSIIPFAQNVVLNLFDIPYYQLDSSTFCTYKELGTNSALGLGTHVVGDVYLATGIVGVIALFYMLGYFISCIKNGAILRNDKYMYVVYLYMLSYSIFLCRGSFFGAVKGIVWSAIILSLVNKKILK